METADLLKLPGPREVGAGEQGRPQRQSPSPGRLEREGHQFQCRQEERQRERV